MYSLLLLHILAMQTVTHCSPIYRVMCFKEYWFLLRGLLTKAIHLTRNRFVYLLPHRVSSMTQPA